jgi:hypothetical protein
VGKFFPKKETLQKRRGSGGLGVKGEKGRCWSSLQGLNYFQLSKPGKIPQ